MVEAVHDAGTGEELEAGLAECVAGRPAERAGAGLGEDAAWSELQGEGEVLRVERGQEGLHHHRGEGERVPGGEG